MEAIQEFGQTDTSVASIMKFIAFPRLEKYENRLPKSSTLSEQGRYSIALSVLDWNQSFFDNNPKKNGGISETSAQRCT